MTVNPMAGMKIDSAILHSMAVLREGSSLKKISKEANLSQFCARKFYTDSSAKNVIGFSRSVSVAFLAPPFARRLSTLADH
jgi:hypothetical protein